MPCHNSPTCDCKGEIHLIAITFPKIPTPNSPKRSKCSLLQAYKETWTTPRLANQIPIQCIQLAGKSTSGQWGGYPGVIITRQFRMKINLRRGEEVVTTAGIYLWSHATRHANSWDSQDQKTVCSWTCMLLPSKTLAPFQSWSSSTGEAFRREAAMRWGFMMDSTWVPAAWWSCLVATSAYFGWITKKIAEAV